MLFKDNGEIVVCCTGCNTSILIILGTGVLQPLKNGAKLYLKKIYDYSSCIVGNVVQIWYMSQSLAGAVTFCTFYSIWPFKGTHLPN